LAFGVGCEPGNLHALLVDKANFRALGHKGAACAWTSSQSAHGSHGSRRKPTGADTRTQAGIKVHACAMPAHGNDAVAAGTIFVSRSRMANATNQRTLLDRSLRGWLGIAGHCYARSAAAVVRSLHDGLAPRPFHAGHSRGLGAAAQGALAAIAFEGIGHVR